MGNLNNNEMEELTGILFVVGAIVLKVIEAKFKKAAKKPEHMAQPYEVFPEVKAQPEDDLPDWVHELSRPEPVIPDPVEVKEVEVKPAEEERIISFAEAKKQMMQVSKRPVRKPILEEEEEKTREKLDPKKLIVYSEIMNRKF